MNTKEERDESVCNPLTSSEHDTLGQWRKRSQKAHTNCKVILMIQIMSPLSQENHIERGLIYNYIASYFCPLVTSERVRVSTTADLRSDKRF